VQKIGFTSGMVAQILGVSVGAIRHWERLGFIKPHRTPGGWRVFKPRDVESMAKRIRNAKHKWTTEDR